MLVKKYETRLNKDGLITFEKVWSKRIDIGIDKNEFRHPRYIYELCKSLQLDTYSEEHVFLLTFDKKCILNLSLRLASEMFPQVLSTNVE